MARPLPFEGKIDLLVVGAGPAGCAIAERAASAGWRVLLVDKRDHLGGNCHDFVNELGIRVQRYGLHALATDRQPVIDYLSRFTTWTDVEWSSCTRVLRKTLPLPINLTTLEKFFGRALTAETAVQLVDKRKVAFANPANAEEKILSQVGKEIYEAFFVGYLQKMWGLAPRELDASVCDEPLVRFDREEKLLTKASQKLPTDGFTEMFRKMVTHENIAIWLGTDFETIRHEIAPSKATVYTGPLDAYFGFSDGKLAWRCLEYEFKNFESEFYQDAAEVTEASAQVPFTRSLEFKRFTKQKTENTTTVAFESSRPNGEPFFPVRSKIIDMRVARYRELSAQETRRYRVYFSGPLAEYREAADDEIIHSALALFEQIKADSLLKPTVEPSPVAQVAAAAGTASTPPTPKSSGFFKFFRK